MTCVTLPWVRAAAVEVVGGRADEMVGWVIEVELRGRDRLPTARANYHNGAARTTFKSLQRRRGPVPGRCRATRDRLLADSFLSSLGGSASMRARWAILTSV